MNRVWGVAKSGCSNYEKRAGYCKKTNDFIMRIEDTLNILGAGANVSGICKYL